MHFFCVLQKHIHMPIRQSDHENVHVCMCVDVSVSVHLDSAVMWIITCFLHLAKGVKREGGMRMIQDEYGEDGEGMIQDKYGEDGEGMRRGGCIYYVSTFLSCEHSCTTILL